MQVHNDELLRTLDLHSKVSITDCQGRIIDVNDNFCRISGYSRAELLGQSHSIVNSGRQSRQFWTDMWSTIRGGRTWRGEICNRAKDGSLYWVDTIIAPFPSAGGQPEKYISIRTDITAVKLTEEHLRASEAFLDRTGQMAGIGGWQFDIDTQRVVWSAHMNRIHEMPVEFQPTLEQGLSFYPGPARLKIERAMKLAMDTGTGWDMELPMITAARREVWVRSVCIVECIDGRPARLIGSTQDITTRKDTEKALTYERDLMASLLETLPDQIYFKDRDSRFLRVNAGMARRHGLNSPAEAVGRSDADYFPEEFALRAIEIEREIMESGEPALDLEEQALWPDRPPTWSLTTKMPLYDADDCIVGTFGISRDITARKRVEAQLLQTNARFAIAADSAGIGVWEYDPYTRMLNWDAWMYRIYGLSQAAGSEPYALWVNCLHPDDRERCEAEMEKALRGEKEFDTEFRIVRPDGQIRHLQAASHTLRSGTAVGARMTGVTFDVTDRRRAEHELLETSSMLRTVLDSAAETSVIATDPGLTIKVFNAGAQRLLGYAAEDVVGRATLMAMHDPEELRLRAEELGAQLGRPIDGSLVLVDPTVLDRARDWIYRRKDGTHVAVSLVVSAMMSQSGDLLGYLGVAHDVTRQRQHEESLRDATQRAEMANRAKSAFLANMSHEIRTPMNAVIGLSYLLAQSNLDAGQRDLLSKIQASSNSLLAVINDVLDLTKIEAGELIVERNVFSPYGVVNGVAELMATAAEAKGIGFEVVMPPDLPTALHGDATRLTQILNNLLANAIKFTERGRVTLCVSRSDDAATDATLRFIVRDTGIGISPEAQARLFAPFAQADASITRRYGGTGLGLSIVKSLANLLGGDIELRSTPGVGSEFTVTLKFAVAAPDSVSDRAADPQASDQRTLRGVRVLVVDDSVINMDVTKRILELQGAQVSLASNGLEAVNRLSDQPYDFDVVLMDVHMPVLDGYEATRRIRAELGLVDLPIIALTAGALSSERQRAVAAGMDDFIVKPFEPKSLADTIKRHVQISALQAATPIPLPTYRTSSPLPWPVIEGIDSIDARVRLCDDFGLFQSSLKRLLDEFSSAAIARLSASPDDLAEFAAFMHKLIGCAGMLGATEIRQKAVEVRAACVAGDAAGAALLAGELVVGLEAMRRSAASVVAMARTPEPSAPDSDRGDVPLQPQRLEALIQSLRDQSLSGLYRFGDLSSQLRAHLGSERFECVRDLMENLRFPEAAALLQESQAAGADAGNLPSSASRSVTSNSELENGFSSSTVSGPTMP